MKVLLLSRYGELGASSRLRSYQYIPYLQKHGFDVTTKPLFPNEYLHQLYEDMGKDPLLVLRSYFDRLSSLTRLKNYDLLWVEKELFPFFPPIAESFLSHSSIPLIVDYDDPIFHRYDNHSNPFVRFLFKDKIDSIMKNSNLVIAGNDYIKQRAKQAGAKHVGILPTVVDLDKYESVKSYAWDGTFTVGWIGSPVTSRYLNLIQKPLSKITEAKNTKVKLIGSGETELESVSLQVKSWSEDTEVESVKSFDVGIMPLPDNPWERGKCGYKLVQYMACGIPVVASPVGVNKKIIDHRRNGFLVQSDDKWVSVLTQLKNDKELRKKLGKAGRRKVERKYSLQTAAPRLANMLKEQIE